jgi:hypothetical protein
MRRRGKEAGTLSRLPIGLGVAAPCDLFIIWHRLSLIDQYSAGNELLTKSI